jgi:plastocyanin
VLASNNTTVIILGISIAAIAISLALFAITIPILTTQHESNQNTIQQNSTQPYAGVKKEFYLFDSEIPGFNETEMGMPHDTFSMPTMAVFKGDKVVIHFFNIEEPGGDSHSFTIYQPYNIDVVVHPRENKTITFVANTTGTFAYLCTFHQPTMRGQLMVLPHP